MSQTVLILGGQGVLGSMVADAFNQSGWTTVRASRRAGAAPAVARHRTASIPLPAPFGRTRCLSLGERDNGWLGPVADGKTVSSYFCLTPRPVRYALLAVNAAGLLGRLPRGAMPAKPPGPVAVASAEPIAHWVAVRRKGTCLAARTVRARGDYRSSAAITVLFAQALTRPGSPARPGVLFPEEAVTLDDIRPGLAGAGITIVHEQTTP
jgi:hypothetical protein